MNRGEIWLCTFKPPAKRRPVLVLSRPDVIPLLSTVMVAPITSTIRGAPSEVVVGIDEGLKTESAVNLDHVAHGALRWRSLSPATHTVHSHAAGRDAVTKV